jgi:hypothetical protein
MYDEHGGHSIHTFALDLVNAIDPRPSRYAPPDPVFAPMSSRRWRLHFIPLSNEDELGPAVAQFAEAPFLTWQTSGGLPGETLVCDVYSPTASKPEWEAGPAAIRQISSALHDAVSHTVYSITLPPAQLPGTYLPLRLCTGSRQISPQAYVRGQWERYIHTASAHALSTRPPVATYVIEAAMPAFSLLAAERLSPSPTRRASIEGFLRDSLFSAAFSPDGEQLMLPSRIQNQTTSVDFCREMYLGCNDKYWLEMAEKTAVRFLETQADDGAYRTRDEGNHYTCVYYPAKSLMDLAIVERQVATACNDLGERARHSELATRLLDSAGMAMDDLLRRGVDVGTEGAPTYEDGAISCASLQMTLWSLMTGDRRFADMGQEMMQGHRCVEWRGADARTHGATIRFWESFWAIGMANFLNTPHGWSAWTAYAWYYLYLATGDVTHYHRFHNTLMTCLSLIDIAIGGVHFCYTPESTVYDGAGRALAGESTFHLVRPNEGGQGGGESHEVIKLVMDTVLSTAFLLYGEAGWEGLNVAIKNESGKTRVQPASPRISRLYVNYAGADPKALPELDGWNANAIIVLPCTDPIAFFSTV